jgi:hypothetical protein
MKGIRPLAGESITALRHVSGDAAPPAHQRPQYGRHDRQCRSGNAAVERSSIPCTPAGSVTVIDDEGRPVDAAGLKRDGSLGWPRADRAGWTPADVRAVDIVRMLAADAVRRSATATPTPR